MNNPFLKPKPPRTKRDIVLVSDLDSDNDKSAVVSARKAGQLKKKGKTFVSRNTQCQNEKAYIKEECSKFDRETTEKDDMKKRKTDTLTTHANATLSQTCLKAIDTAQEMGIPDEELMVFLQTTLSSMFPATEASHSEKERIGREGSGVVERGGGTPTPDDLQCVDKHMARQVLTTRRTGEDVSHETVRANQNLRPIFIDDKVPTCKDLVQGFYMLRRGRVQAVERAEQYWCAKLLPRL